MITIYGKPQCPYCDKAKALCDMRGLEYTYKTLGIDYQIDELLETFPGAKTVPQIIINEQKIVDTLSFQNTLMIQITTEPVMR